MPKKSLSSDVAKLVAYADSKLDLTNARLSPGYYYHSLPFAVVDAVFSIGVKYEQVRHAVHYFSSAAGWGPIYRDFGSRFPAKTDQKTISHLVEAFAGIDDPSVTLFANRGFANPAARKPTRKATVVLAVARVLANHGVQTFQDLAEHAQPDSLDRALREGPPAMSSGVIVHYLRMLAGNDNEVKVDRMIQRFIEAADVPRPETLEEAVLIVRETAYALKKRGFSQITPRLLDHTIWSYQRLQVGVKSNILRRNNSIDTLTMKPSAPLPATILRDKVEFEEFWAACKSGGITPEGISFGVDDDERLKIISPRSKNQNYRILKSTVKKYLPKAHEGNFRRSHGWFCRVYEYLLCRP